MSKKDDKKTKKKGVRLMNMDRKEFRESPEGQKYNHISWAVVRVFAICLFMVFLLFRADAIMGGLSWIISSMRSVLLGLGFGYILSPLDNNIRRNSYKFFLKHNKDGKLTEAKAKKRARVVGVSLASLIGIGTIIALLLLIIPAFLDSITNLSDVVSSNLSKLTDWLDTHRSGNTVAELIGKAADALQDWIETGLSDSIAQLTGTIVSAGMEIMAYLLDFLIAFFVTIYTLLEKENFARQTKKLLYATFKKPETVNRILDIARHSNEIFGDFMSGKLLDSLIIGIICFLLMSILRIPYSVLVSVVIAVTNIIPFLGPFIGGVPAAAIILLASPQKGIVFIIMFIILQQVDGNIIGPWILGDRTGVSAFWIICSLLLFKALFGLLGTGMSVVGMIVGVPLFCVIEYLISSRVQTKLEAKGMESRELDYKEIASYDTEKNCYIPLPPPAEKESLHERVVEYFETCKASLSKLFGKKKDKKGKKEKKDKEQ